MVRPGNSNRRLGPFILYTTIVLSFYASRIAVVRHLETHGTLSKEMFWRVEKDGKMIAKVIGTPLLLLYGVSLFLSFWNGRESILLVVNTLSIIVAWLFMDGLGNVAGEIYASFDPRYHVTEPQQEPQSSEQGAAPDKQNTAPR